MQLYVVRPSDTLYAIALRYGTTVQAIMATNGLTGTMIFVGQRLVVPGGPSRIYLVQRGDTLWSIAQRFGTTVQAIRAANGLRSTTIFVGQRLTIPASGYLPPAPQPTRIQFQPGSVSATVEGSLAANELDTYVFRALAGQTMTVTVAASRANGLFSIHGANGEVLKSAGVGGATWSGQLPETQDYYITISAEGGVATPYALQVTIPPL